MSAGAWVEIAQGVGLTLLYCAAAFGLFWYGQSMSVKDRRR
jgi:hypothetical protein